MKATYLDHMGTDLSVVNAARVSFGKQSEWDWVEEGGIGLGSYQELSKADQGLIQFLARGCTSGDWEEAINEMYYCGEEDDWGQLEHLVKEIRKMPPHWTPFAHTAISIHLKMPIFVARQIMKTSTGMVYNEISRRYVDDEPEFFVPEAWRKAASNVKQGSGGKFYGKGQADASQKQKVANDAALAMYRAMLDQGVAPEQARMVLPQSMYTEVIATGNLFSWANLYVQRTDSHAQKETQDLACQIGEIINPLYPVSWSALCS